MAELFELTIVTPEGQAFEGSVHSVVLPGVEGDFGVLYGHEPFLTALRIGGLEVEPEGGERRHAAVGRGFAEISGSEVSVMVATCEWADEIDRERAERAAERARKQLEEMRATADGSAEIEKYQDAYSRALSRVSVSSRFKG